MTATPTPGDLSARHVTTLKTMIHQGEEGEICICAECRALRYTIAALEAALTRQPVAGGGMVLVPREPTEAMVEATDCAPRLARVTWAKMLAAAATDTSDDIEK